MTVNQFFFQTPNFGMYATSGSEMKRVGDHIHYEHQDFDLEDQRKYCYCFSMDIKEYREALEKLQKEGSVELKREGSGHMDSGATFSMSLKEGIVHISCSGAGGTDGGGRMVYSTVRDSCNLEDLMLEE